MKGNPTLYGIGYHYRSITPDYVICCPPKNGCSVLKFSLLTQEHSYLRPLLLADPSQVHRFTFRINIKSYNDIHAAPLVFVAREPFARAISAFVSKFVLFPEDSITSTITRLADTPMMEMSFRVYVHTLAAAPDHLLDPHFVSQSAFLCADLSCYRVISLETQGESSYSTFLDNISPQSRPDFSAAEDKALLRLIPGGYQTANLGAPAGFLVDRPVKQLRELLLSGLRLHAMSFLTQELKSLIDARYSHDLLLTKGSSPGLRRQRSRKE